MTMEDWALHLDRILIMSGENLLQGAGSVSREQANEKATNEYKKYQQKTLSEAELNYLESLKILDQKQSVNKSNLSDFYLNGLMKSFETNKVFSL